MNNLISLPQAMASQRPAFSLSVPSRPQQPAMLGVEDSEQRAAVCRPQIFLYAI